SYIALRTVTIACWTILSSTVAMPNGRCLPLPFGIHRLFEGCARYAPRCTRLCRSFSLSSSPMAYSCHVIPSTPGAAFRFNALKLSRSSSGVTWCSKAVNRSCLFLRALSRTPCNPWGTLSPLWVGRVLDSTMFSLVKGLPSTTSAAGVSACLVRQFRWYYALVRLLADVHAQVVLLAFWTDPAAGYAAGYRRGLSVLARAVSRRAYGSWTTPGLAKSRNIVPVSVAFPWQALGRRPVFVFRSSIPRPSMPLSTLHPEPHVLPAQDSGSRWFATPFL